MIEFCGGDCQIFPRRGAGSQRFLCHLLFSFCFVSRYSLINLKNENNLNGKNKFNKIERDFKYYQDINYV